MVIWLAGLIFCHNLYLFLNEGLMMILLVVRTQSISKPIIPNFDYMFSFHSTVYTTLKMRVSRWPRTPQFSVLSVLSVLSSLSQFSSVLSSSSSTPPPRKTSVIIQANNSKFCIYVQLYHSLNASVMVTNYLSNNLS